MLSKTLCSPGLPSSMAIQTGSPFSSSPLGSPVTGPQDSILRLLSVYPHFFGDLLWPLGSDSTSLTLHLTIYVPPSYIPPLTSRCLLASPFLCLKCIPHITCKNKKQKHKTQKLSIFSSKPVPTSLFEISVNWNFIIPRAQAKILEAIFEILSLCSICRKFVQPYFVHSLKPYGNFTHGSPPPF